MSQAERFTDHGRRWNRTRLLGVSSRCVCIRVEQGKPDGSPTVPSWNQLLRWLRDVDLLRKVEAA
jgi:hypothetical protein